MAASAAAEHVPVGLLVVDQQQLAVSNALVLMGSTSSRSREWSDDFGRPRRPAAPCAGPADAAVCATRTAAAVVTVSPQSQAAHE